MDKNVKITFLTPTQYELDKEKQIHAFMLILVCIYGWGKSIFLMDNNEIQNEL